jgi:hypothetical protein
MPGHNLSTDFQLAQIATQKQMLENITKPAIHKVLLDISQYIQVQGCTEDLEEALGNVVGYVNRLVKEYEPDKKG